jgi:hypothetical protein
LRIPEGLAAVQDDVVVDEQGVTWAQSKREAHFRPRQHGLDTVESPSSGAW